jgi:hypothetical protein
MTNEALLEKFGKLIEPVLAQLYEQGANIVRLVQGQTRIEKRLDNIEDTQARIKTVVETLEASQKDMQEHIRADIQDAGARLDRKLKNHERRIENLEETTNTTIPFRN